MSIIQKQTSESVRYLTDEEALARRDDVPCVRSEALLGERGELTIEHAGRSYRLRQTRAGKLILTA